MCVSNVCVYFAAPLPVRVVGRGRPAVRRRDVQRAVRVLPGMHRRPLLRMGPGAQRLQALRHGVSTISFFTKPPESFPGRDLFEVIRSFAFPD